MHADVTRGWHASKEVTYDIPPRFAGLPDKRVKCDLHLAISPLYAGDMMPTDTAQALADHQYETARRRCLQILADHASAPESCGEVLYDLHKALRGLGDICACQKLLEQMRARDGREQFAIELLAAENHHLLKSEHFYRNSIEKRNGLTLDEYREVHGQLAAEYLNRARRFAATREQIARLEAAENCIIRRANTIAAAPQCAAKPASPTGTYSCDVYDADGQPAAGIRITLGLAAPHEKINVHQAEFRPDLADMDFRPAIGPAETMTAMTDDSGRCIFENVPAGRHDYIAATLKDQEQQILTCFLAQDIDVVAGAQNKSRLTITPWQSAAPEAIHHSFPAIRDDGALLVRVISVRNPFYYDFPRQLISLSLQKNWEAENLLIFCNQQPDRAITYQIVDGRVTFFADLPEQSERTWAVYQSQASCRQSSEHLRLIQDPAAQTAVIHTGRAEFRIPFGTSSSALPPLLGVRGEDGLWRGTGRFILPPGVSITLYDCQVVNHGPLLLRIRLAYRTSTGHEYRITWTAHENEPYLLAEEISEDLAGGMFEFSLAEFSGGRGYLYWMSENGSYHWSDLAAQERELARLQESVAWWIPPQGFGYAMMGKDASSRDYIAVYTQRRGEWVDRQFERIAQGPGDNNRELDWPFPEMVGSTISMITAHTSSEGDAFFRFRFFDGRRYWGILASTLDRNDGPRKELSAVSHKNSSPRLEDFMRWRLDEQDQVERPFLVARRKDLPDLRRKRESAAFREIWRKIREEKVAGPAAGLRFAVEGDPQIAWRKKLEILSIVHLRARLVLSGREISDVYSPVGARPLTRWAEDYDLIAGSGVFTPDEERLIRSFFMLMGHLYMSPDMMNWRFNSRNANFEADRVDVIGTIGLVFHGNPDAAEFVRHAAELMENSLNIYCTPGSGKWYENPACYYLQAARCRLNLAYHLASHGIQNPALIARLKDFLRWGILLLTPPCPHDYGQMRDGLSSAGYRQAPKVRRIAPIGDHAHLGPWVPEHYALMAKLYRQSDPEFARMLLWAWQSGGCDGGFFGNLPLVFAQLSAEDLEPAAPAALTSRRLEGFGAVFRGQFNQHDEFYLLFKQGPGGYRYHRTEGSVILFADGKPLIYDGGEGGETWRHTTLSFGAAHTPLAPGHVERFFSCDSADFVQGVHPAALMPEDPVFLSDLCEDRLVALAHERFAEKKPADVRSVFWAKNHYVILHDDLALPRNLLTHWHLQAVSDSHTGDPSSGFRFNGRFGTDLHVRLLGPPFQDIHIEQTPLLDYHRSPKETFSMRHMRASAVSPDTILAVLEPLSQNQEPLAAEPLRAGQKIVGVEIHGPGMHDYLVIQREKMRISISDALIDARYAAILLREAFTSILLLGEGFCRWQNITVSSTGAHIVLRMTPGDATITAEGCGMVVIRGLARELTFNLDQDRKQVTLPLTR